MPACPTACLLARLPAQPPACLPARLPARPPANLSIRPRVPNSWRTQVFVALLPLAPQFTHSFSLGGSQAGALSLLPQFVFVLDPTFVFITLYSLLCALLDAPAGGLMFLLMLLWRHAALSFVGIAELSMAAQAAIAAIAFVLVGFVIPVLVGHWHVEDYALDDSNHNLSEAVTNPVPIFALPFYTHLEFMFEMGYRPDLAEEIYSINRFVRYKQESRAANKLAASQLVSKCRFPVGQSRPDTRTHTAVVSVIAVFLIGFLSLELSLMLEAQPRMDVELHVGLAAPVAGDVLLWFQVTDPVLQVCYPLGYLTLLVSSLLSSGQRPGLSVAGLETSLLSLLGLALHCVRSSLVNEARLLHGTEPVLAVKKLGELALIVAIMMAALCANVFILCLLKGLPRRPEYLLLALTVALNGTDLLFDLPAWINPNANTLRACLINNTYHATQFIHSFQAPTIIACLVLLSVYRLAAQRTRYDITFALMLICGAPLFLLGVEPAEHAMGAHVEAEGLVTATAANKHARSISQQLMVVAVSYDS